MEFVHDGNGVLKICKVTGKKKKTVATEDLDPSTGQAVSLVKSHNFSESFPQLQNEGAKSCSVCLQALLCSSNGTFAKHCTR